VRDGVVRAEVGCVGLGNDGAGMAPRGKVELMKPLPPPPPLTTAMPAPPGRMLHSVPCLSLLPMTRLPTSSILPSLPRCTITTSFSGL
jgi:hypothetical protein